MLKLTLCFLTAVFAWTFFEYAMHHWVFHKLKRQTMGKREHMQHHARSGYFTPLSLKARLALLGGSLVFGLAWLITDLETASYFTVFFGLSYCFYERIHYLTHAQAPRNWYGRWARKHHFAHHFHDARTNHGVTSPLWDIVFGTLHTRDVIRVPRRFVMPWLIDEQGQLRSPFETDYVLR